MSFAVLTARVEQEYLTAWATDPLAVSLRSEIHELSAAESSHTNSRYVRRIGASGPARSIAPSRSAPRDPGGVGASSGPHNRVLGGELTQRLLVVGLDGMRRTLRQLTLILALRKSRKTIVLEDALDRESAGAAGNGDLDSGTGRLVQQGLADGRLH